jgi:sigma-B regulation protein RsbU (phosphoserine phosphatase)
MLGGALASLRALAKRGESLAQMVMELNRTLWELSPEDSFTPFLCAQVDPSCRCLRYVNAGHEPGLLIHGRNGQVDRLESTGAVLGLSVRGAYRERMIPFEPGDLLAVFTDGIAESAGPDQVIRILREGLRSGVQELAAHVLDSAEAAVDRTIVLVRSTEAESVPLPMQHYEMAAA